MGMSHASIFQNNWHSYCLVWLKQCDALPNRASSCFAPNKPLLYMLIIVSNTNGLEEYHMNAKFEMDIHIYWKIMSCGKLKKNLDKSRQDQTRQDLAAPRQNVSPGFEKYCK